METVGLRRTTTKRNKARDFLGWTALLIWIWTRIIWPVTNSESHHDLNQCKVVFEEDCSYSPTDGMSIWSFRWKYKHQHTHGSQDNTRNTEQVRLKASASV